MPRKAAFVTVATDQGTFIVNRFDWKAQGDGAVGLGIEMLEQSAYQPQEVDTAIGLLELRRRYYGEGVVAIDGGANIGVHTIAWASSMTTWGKVLAIEPQERLFYALGGNICLNNCFNASAICAALADHDGSYLMAVPDYTAPANFGGLSITMPNDDFGQDLSEVASVRSLKLDSLKLLRCDFLKLDVEGMEVEALRGAADLIATCRPVLMVECILCDQTKLLALLAEHGYEAYRFGMNLICAHRLDKTRDHIEHLHRTLLRATFERQELETA